MEEYKNKAVLREIEKINIVIRPFRENVTASCHRLIGKCEQNRWIYGVVTVSFPVKGNIKLLNVLKFNGYTVRRVKNTEFDRCKMWAIAEKNIELEY